jgi:RHS repeat-associated protein
VTDTYDPSTTLRAGMDTFGRELGSTGSTPNPYRYGAAWGYITDPSGFLQLGARYYWPEVGRFVSQDPVRDDGSLYAYVTNNPVVKIDPDGLKTRSECYEEFRDAEVNCDVNSGITQSGIAATSIGLACTGYLSPGAVVTASVGTVANLAGNWWCHRNAKKALRRCLKYATPDPPAPACHVSSPPTPGVVPPGWGH